MFATIDFPGTSATLGTSPLRINNGEEIVGIYTGSGLRIHGFLKKGSSFTPLDVPFPGVTDTFPNGINNMSEIVGLYVDGSGRHGFIFSKGEFTQLDVSFPGVSVAETDPADINDLGEIVGSYSTAAQTFFGFLAKP
jgi:hypothetical protein